LIEDLKGRFFCCGIRERAFGFILIYVYICLVVIVNTGCFLWITA
jgi:hypothetical protein